MDVGDAMIGTIHKVHTQTREKEGQIKRVQVCTKGGGKGRKVSNYDSIMDKKKLDHFYTLINDTVLVNQDTLTGLIPASNTNLHAWIRDNTYAVLSVWGLSLAYRKVPDVDEDRSRGYELEKCVVKLMRGILTCLMRQVDKVERFKHSQDPNDSLHCKFNSVNCKPVVGDRDWGHLQIDAVAIFLLTVAQMTASGIYTIWTIEEVAFIQNLVFYVELAYRIPDYGVWERGDKTNHGFPELNSSSVGMAKAALEAMSDLDLFGAHGGPESTIHVLADEAQQCQAVLQSMLPRESYSKEIDAALLSIIGYPAFAVNDDELIEHTRTTIQEKLEGRYGFKRFLRDGYRTAREDPHRLHYEPFELTQFENIECEWPMFFCYLVLDAYFRGDLEMAQNYMTKLEALANKENPNCLLMPESFSVPRDKTEREAEDPGSQERIPVGRLPHVWTQSLYILSMMLRDGILLPGEIDPLGRRMVTEPKPDLVVQVVVVAEDDTIKHRLAQYQLDVQTFTDIQADSGINVFPAKVLGHFYKHLGKSAVLNLTGRATKDVGILATSKLYTVGSETVAFTPQFLDFHAFYLSLDIEFLLDMFRTDVAFLRRSWSNPGRPTLLIPVYDWYFQEEFDVRQEGAQPALVATIKKLQSGYLNATRVKMGKLSEFVSTACITKLSFLKSTEELLSKMTPIRPTIQSRKRLVSISGGNKTEDSTRASVDTNAMANARHMAMRKKSIALTSAVAFDLGGSDDDGFHRFKTSYSGHRGNMSTPCMAAVDENQDECDTLSPGASSEGRFFGSFSGTLSDNEDEEADDPTHNATHKGILRLIQPATKEDLKPHGSNANMMRRIMSATGSRAMFAEEPVAMGPTESNPEVIVDKLSKTEDIYEQVDLIHQLYQSRGLDWTTTMGGYQCTVRDLLKEVYERAGQLTQWLLVRFTAGLLRKRVEHLAKALTDILVRQKQVTVGLPPEPREKIISRPLTPKQLADLIHEACGEDFSMAMLTQELLVYLSMFARTEPQLLNQMLRLRVGLIIQVMASELGRTLHCTGEEASMHLFNLSPCETKLLLHHILSGKEFRLTQGTVRQRRSSIRAPSEKGMKWDRLKNSMPRRKSTRGGVGPMTFSQLVQAASNTASTRRMSHMASGMSGLLSPTDVNAGVEDSSEPEDTDRQGQWLRRRKIDGALNRVPPRFYNKLWKVLERVQGIAVADHIISQNLTKEMTENETKFALVVEGVMNNVPVPEYRQMLVEAITILSGVIEMDRECFIHVSDVIKIDYVVKTANRLFLDDQVKFDGDACLCCAVSPRKSVSSPGCRGACQLCAHFYDSAPSGRYGSMTYIFMAFAQIFQLPTNDRGEFSAECCLQ